MIERARGREWEPVESASGSGVAEKQVKPTALLQRREILEASFRRQVERSQEQQRSPERKAEVERRREALKSALQVYPSA